MNSTRPFTRSANKFFRPAFDYLNNNNPRDKNRQQSYSPRRKNSASSLDDTDHSDIEHYAQMEPAPLESQAGVKSPSESQLQPPVPLIDIRSSSRSSSRAPSPYPRSRSAVQSEDEDDDDFEPADSIRPLVSHDVGRGGRGWRGIFRQGGLGAFFFGTWLGWQIWVGMLVFWVGGCSFGLLLMNRFILLTGVYKFPYPLMSTYIQLLATHFVLLTFTSLTRAFGGPLRMIGFGAAVAPSYPPAPVAGSFRATTKKPSLLRFGHWLTNGSGGIAGGGLFEFDPKIAKQVLPLAIVFVLRVLLSTFSFAYAPLNVYQLSRIGTIPCALLFSAMLQKETHSASTLSSALVSSLMLLFASLRSNVRVTWDSVLAGVLSSIFAALFPILLLRTYRTLVAGLVPQGDLLTSYPSPTDPTTAGGNREETRAYYRTLHYTSLLSLLLLTPVVLLSGDVGNILRNIPFLDVPFFWLMIWCGSLGSFATFTSTLLLVKATSPLTTSFLMVPRSAFQIGMLNLWRVPAHCWVGVVLCWVSSLWFLVAKRSEGRTLDRMRLEGRWGWRSGGFDS